MNLTCRDIGLNLAVDDALLEQLYNIGLKHYPKEFGGLLIGNYSEDMKTCVITGTLLPKKYKSSRYYFERGREGLLEKLEALYNAEPRSIYIGEWHTHPDGPASPSDTDEEAMQTISEHDEVTITNPLLLILAITPEGYTFGFYVNFKNKL